MTLACLPLRHFLSLALVAVLACLCACADMSKTECAQADWRQLGYEDAMSGQTVARFGRRSEACRKNGLPADRALYEAGHAQGQAGFCTAARGRGDALAGQAPAALCAADPVGDPYRQGHAAGLQQFCTASSGYEYGRKGQGDHQVCPPELVAAFQIGFRMGHEWFDLNQRLADIQKQAADERAVLADTKTPPDRRDAANRHLGQLDADEAATRKLIRQAELSALSLAQPGGLPAPAPAPGPSSGVAAEWLPGQWRMASVSFGTPVDLNRDGVKSSDGMSELSPCLRDRQIDLEGDQRAFLRTGVHTPGCLPVNQIYRWRTEEQLCAGPPQAQWLPPRGAERGRGTVPADCSSPREESGLASPDAACKAGAVCGDRGPTSKGTRKEGRRRVGTERPVLLLRLRGVRDDEVPAMVVEDVDATYLIVRTEMPDGTESTREAVVTYRRVGR